MNTKQMHRAECQDCTYRSRWFYDSANAELAARRHEAATGHKAGHR